MHLTKDGWPVWSWADDRCRPVRSWGWDNNRSRPVRSWGRHNNWGSSISWGRGSSIDGLSRVLNISNVTSVGIRSVGNSLDATIGKGNMVFSLGCITIAGLRSTNVGTSVSIIDSIGVVICWGNISVDWGRSISWGRGSSVDRFSGVLDISNIAIAISIVGDSLETTAGGSFMKKPVKASN